MFSSLFPRLALKLAVRSFRREWGIALTAALTLSIGFGAACAIFSVLNGFGRDLPVPDGARVVQVRLSTREPIGSATTVDLLRVWTREQRSLSGIEGFQVRSSTLQDPEIPPTRVSGATVTPGALPLLGVAPMLGGFPYPSATENTVLIGHSIWYARYGADPGIVGKTVRVDGLPHTVVGVMPEEFAFPYNQELWIPVARESMDGNSLEIFGRLAPGVSNTQAAAGLQAIANRQTYFENESNAPPTVSVEEFTSARGEGGERIALLALLLVVVALLAVSCSNVSNLLLVRAIGRSRTMAVHAAIGAAPAQVVLQLLVEALTIALAGGLIGLGVAYLAVEFIERSLSGHWGYYWMRVALDGRAIAFLGILTVATALLSGTVPALRAARANLVEPLKTENSGSTGKSTGWISRGLLTGQIGFSSVALVAAALMTNGLLRSRQVEPGFPATEVYVSTLTLDGDLYDEATQRRRFREDLLAALSNRPTVSTAALSNGLPGMFAPTGRLSIEGRPDDPDQRGNTVLTFGVTPDYFSVFDIALEDGRIFDSSDGADTERVAIVSRDFAERHFPRADPIGQRIRVAGISAPDNWARIVGIVSDVAIYDAYRQSRLDWVYLPLTQLETRSFYVVFRGPDTPVDATAQLQTCTWELDPDMPIGETVAGDGVVRLMDILQYIRTIFGTAGLLALLGGLGALLVASIGLYGVISYDVRRRKRELGVRLALGAGTNRVQRLVLWDAFKRAAPGLALGLGTAYLIAPLFGVLLSGTKARDPVVFGATCVGYLVVCFVATLVPARRAASLDPGEILRSD